MPCQRIRRGPVEARTTSCGGGASTIDACCSGAWINRIRLPIDNSAMAAVWIATVGWKIGAGDQWDNNTLFDFHGNALTSLDAFRKR
ncbi:hypothetical protein [Paraburkholderia sediminicola]|uniref:hypothetical protein n=1 Tax=Paraburkholderia sediminicola TaxID=458836 RepID=UPI0038B8270A